MLGIVFNLQKPCCHTEGSFPPLADCDEVSPQKNPSKKIAMINKKMKKITFIFLIAAIAIAVITCKKTPEIPTGNNKIEIGETTIDSVAYFTANVNTVIISAGVGEITQHGHCWSVNKSPSIEDAKTELGSLTNNVETFTSELNELSENSIYYVRPYINTKNNTIYGNVNQFNTLSTSKPIISTKNITDVTLYSALSGGIIISDGGNQILSKGVCWNTTGNPTLQNNIGHLYDTISSDNYTINISPLNKNTAYFVTAFAINDIGVGYGEEVKFNTLSISIDMIYVEGGTFLMGSDSGYISEQPIHNVVLNDFNISKYEITTIQFSDFLNSINCSPDGIFNDTIFVAMDDSTRNINIDFQNEHFVPTINYENMPVLSVSWDGARAFAIWAGGRLPTEAEWEYSAKGGKSSQGFIYAGSNDVNNVCWNMENSLNQRKNIGQKNPNELEIYDMSGNVSEWCNDWYDVDYYSISPNSNPQGPDSGISRITRGGSVSRPNVSCRVTAREPHSPSGVGISTGFRIVR